MKHLPITNIEDSIEDYIDEIEDLADSIEDYLDEIEDLVETSTNITFIEK